MLADRKITLELTDAARKAIFKAGYDRAYGARPLKRAIQRMVQDKLAVKILDGKRAAWRPCGGDAGKSGLEFKVDGARGGVRPKRVLGEVGGGSGVAFPYSCRSRPGYFQASDHYWGGAGGVDGGAGVAAADGHQPIDSGGERGDWRDLAHD
jgi:hypothetical protein